MSKKIYALLVGIDNYPDPNHRLQGCANDITAIEEYLNERFDQQKYQLHLQTLKDNQGTREAVIDGFRNHLCQAGQDDVVLFYYSGHGSQELAPEEFWHLEPDHLDETLVCYDSRTENGWDLADKELAKLIAEVAENEPHITIILDCCHSGSGTKDPMQETKERRFPADKRKRPLDSFIFKLEDLDKLSDTSRDPEKHPTGWKIPKGRHVLLAACRDHETAKEYRSKQRGYFSYFLMDTLSKTNGKLTYRDLFARTNAIVRSESIDQSPQLEVNHSEDSDKFFLDGAIAEVEPYFIVKHDQTTGWVIEGGAIHGVQPPKNDETTLLALFPFDANIDDLRDPSKSVGTAKVTQVLPTKSKIDIEGVQNLTSDRTFKAVVTSLPLPPLGVYFEGDEAGVELAREQLQTAGFNGNPSAYVREEKDIGNAEFRLLCRNNQYIITRPTDDRPLVTQIEGYTVAQIKGYTAENAKTEIKHLEHIARWTQIAQLSNTAATQIKAGDVKMELIFTDRDLSPSKQMRLPYKYQNGEWQQPEFKLKLTNTTKKPLYSALVNLSDSFSISAPFFEAGSVRLQAGEEAYALDGEELVLEVPDKYWEQGITEYKDMIKLIISNDEFDPRLLTQSQLDAPRPRARDIELPHQSSLERLIDRTQNREIRAKSDAVRFDDWYAEEIMIVTVRPLNTTPVSKEQEQQLGVGVTLKPHPSLEANARLTTTPQVSRDLGNKIVPPILREDPEIIQPFQFTTSRGTDPGLSILELSDVVDHEVVTPDVPLKLLVDAPLAENEYLLPVGYDGEFFLPLGRGKSTVDGKTEIELERLPAPVSEGERSLQGSIRIFFQKVIGKYFGREFKYPILAVAEVGEDKKVTYNQDENYIKQQVANAKRIALYIHGIIGDTESLVSTIKQPVLQPDGQERSIGKLYDLVLTFDYENLNTTIEQNAQHLKRRLRDVGLLENHDKELHIIAHSMGGLVSRWFIEREGGNKVIQHLIMLGTPNAGSPWSVVEDWVKLTLGIGLNGLSLVAWPAKVVAMLMGTLEKNIRVTLAQMNPTSDFLNSLAVSDDPGIPYSIIAGNTSIIPVALEQEADKSILERLQQRLFKKVVEFPFFGEPNDIAVKVDSIKSIPTGRSHPPHIQEVPCDHLSYFLNEPTEVGLKALLAAIADDEYFAVLEEIRQAEIESNFNAQVVYPILERHQDKLDANFVRILEKRARDVFSQANSEQVQALATLIQQLSIHIQQFPLRSRANNLEIAIAGYSLALEVYHKDTFPEKWAANQNNLGTAYRDRIREDKAEDLESAISCYQQALQIYTRQDFPIQWAITQNNLGVAYGDRIRGEKAQNLEREIAAYQKALEVRNKEAFPYEWAMTQNNLAAAYSDRIRGEKAQNLEGALAAYRAALKVYTKEAFPYEWASTQNNLGNAYLYRIREEKAENLERALEAYGAALKVYTKEAFPYEWGITQNNLGNAYSDRIREEKAQNLETALAAYQKALEVHTQEAFPVDWAMTQNNLGNAYRNRIREEKAQNLETSITCYQEALEVRTREAFPYEWGITQHNLAAAYSDRIRGEKAQNLERAIACYQEALKVRTREAFPQNHAETLLNLGTTYQRAKQFTSAYNTFASAIVTVESLREEIVSGEESKRKQAEHFNQVYSRMVEVCLELGNITTAIEYVERSKTRNLVELILDRDLKTIFPLEVANQLEELRDQIASGQYKIQHGTAENPKVLAQELQQLRQQRNELQNRYLPVGSGFKFDQFQATLDRRTAIIEWYITTEKILAFVVKPNGQELTVWQSQPKDREALLNLVSEYLQDYNKTGKNQWRDKLDERLNKLSEILHLESILDQIPPNCDRLILIPHRFLHLLPLHALPIGESYLTDRFPFGVGYAPSCQLLQQVQQRELPDFQSLFAVQNPTGDLQFTDQEVNSILSLFPSHQVLSKSHATKAALDEATPHLQKVNYLHFSCHGSFNPDSPFLLLADAIVSSIPVNADPKQYFEADQGFIDLSKCLTLGNLFERGFDLNKCRLVVLSACETGLIDFENTSDEYIGLPSGFLYAGSSSVVSSLWTVEDKSTAYLMIKFLQNLKVAFDGGKDVSVAVALNQAQDWLRNITREELNVWANSLQLDPKIKGEIVRSTREIVAKNPRSKNIDEKPFQSPYHWAGFTAIGK